MTEAIDAVRRGFVDLAGGAFEMPTRTALGDGRFLVMSAHHRPTSSAMIKTLSLNFERRPAIAGTVVWSETGRLDHLVADAGAVTTLRTGAATGVATDLLAPPDAGRLTMIGAGAQAPDQVRAVHAVRPLRHLTVVDHHPGRAEALVSALRPELDGTELRTATDPDSAVRDAEIVCCATTATQPLFAERRCRSGSTSTPSARSARRCGSCPTNCSPPARRHRRLAAILEESGEIIHALESGAITQDALTELGTALTSGTDRGARTVFKTVGVAMQDSAIARLLAGKFLRYLAPPAAERPRRRRGADGAARARRRGPRRRDPRPRRPHRAQTRRAGPGDRGARRVPRSRPSVPPGAAARARSPSRTRPGWWTPPPTQESRSSPYARTCGGSVSRRSAATPSTSRVPSRSRGPTNATCSRSRRPSRR